MRYRLYREHKYVCAALNDLERQIATADFADDHECEGVQATFEEVAELLKGHAQYENERIHPLLDAKGSTVHHHAANDHGQMKSQVAQIRSLLDRMGGASEEERVELGYQLYLAYRKFVADNLLHLHEEETVLLPELQRLYKDEELRQVEAKTYEEITPDQMVEMVEELAPHMNRWDLAAILADIQALAPDKYATLIDRLSAIS